MKDLITGMFISPEYCNNNVALYFDFYTFKDFQFSKICYDEEIYTVSSESVERARKRPQYKRLHVEFHCFGYGFMIDFKLGKTGECCLYGVKL